MNAHEPSQVEIRERQNMESVSYNMKRLFNPESVAVVGASDNPDKLGFHVMKSLIRGGYTDRIIPVNPTAEVIWGLKAYPSLGQYDGRVDLAIIVVPARFVPEVFNECVDIEVGGIVLITAGFKEIDDPSGADLHEKIADIVETARIPVIGPNTFGMIDYHARLNASFTPEFSMIPKGNIALVSRSGGMSHLLGFLAVRADIGLSKVVGLGNRLNVDFADIIEFLMTDPDTDVIMMYMEGIDDPNRLMSVMKDHEGKKPVVIYKTGSSEKGDKASKSHTGSMAGRHEIYQGAFSQSGILAVDGTQALLDTAKALSRCPLPGGPGVAVLSGQAGPGMAACDISDARLLSICFCPQTIRLKGIELLIIPITRKAPQMEKDRGKLFPERYT